jgi:hypothetical protein
MNVQSLTLHSFQLYSRRLLSLRPACARSSWEDKLRGNLNAIGTKGLRLETLC